MNSVVRELLRRRIVSDELFDALENDRDAEGWTLGEPDSEITRLFTYFDDTIRWPKRIEKQITEWIESNTVLCPFTASDVAQALTEVAAGLDLDLPEHREDVYERMVANLATKLWRTWQDSSIYRDRSIRDVIEEEKKATDAFVIGYELALESAGEHWPTPVDPISRGDCVLYELELMAHPDLREIYVDVSRFGDDGFYGLKWHELEKQRGDLYQQAKEFLGEPRARPWNESIWDDDEWGISLYLIPWIHKNQFDDVNLIWKFVLVGAFTADGLAKTKSVLEPVARQVLATVVDAATVRERVLPEGKVASDDAMKMLKDGFERFEREEFTDEERMEGVPTCMYFFSDEVRRWIRRCIDICLRKECEYQELEREIATTLALLDQSRQTPHDGVAVALAFAAIEALLATENDKLRYILKSYCGILLQPDPEKRKCPKKGKCTRVGKRIEKIAKLYDRRCNVLHGRSLNASAKEKTQAIRLAAGVVRAVCAVWAFTKSVAPRRDGDEYSFNKDELTFQLAVCDKRQQELPGTIDLSDLLPS